MVALIKLIYKGRELTWDDVFVIIQRQDASIAELEMANKMAKWLAAKSKKLQPSRLYPVQPGYRPRTTDHRDMVSTPTLK